MEKLLIHAILFVGMLTANLSNSLHLLQINRTLSRLRAQLRNARCISVAPCASRTSLMNASPTSSFSESLRVMEVSGQDQERVRVTREVQSDGVAEGENVQ